MAPERSESEEPWVTVATLGRVWGRRGELAAECLTSGAERFNGVKEVTLFGPEGAATAVNIHRHAYWPFHERRIISEPAPSGTG